MENVKLRRKGGAAAHDVVSFGDLTTAVLRGLKDRGFHGEADAIVFYDLATDYLEVLPVQSRSRSNTLEAFRRFAGGQTLKLVYSDQAPELKNAVTTLGALHRLSTPGMPKTNGLIENKVKLVLHGARVLLRQAGFKTPKTTSDTLGKLTQRTSMKEETTRSQMKTKRYSLASMLKCEPSCLS